MKNHLKKSLNYKSVIKLSKTRCLIENKMNLLQIN